MVKSKYGGLRRVASTSQGAAMSRNKSSPEKGFKRTQVRRRNSWRVNAKYRKAAATGKTAAMRPFRSRPTAMAAHIARAQRVGWGSSRSEEHTSEFQSRQ